MTTDEGVQKTDGEVTDEVTDGEAGEEAQTKVKIGEMEFASHAEALSWAEQNVNREDTAEAKLDAYRQGLQDARNYGQSAEGVTPAQTPEGDDNLEFETEFYQDPKAALDKIRQQTISEVKEQIKKEQELDRKEQDAWKLFRELNPDLAGSEEVAKMMMNKHAGELQQRATALGQEEAIKYLGQKTRALFQSYSQASLPRENLEQGGATVVDGQGAPVTSKKKEETPLSFTDQLRSINKGKPTGA